MKGLFFILFSTFLVGMASGVFIYFVSNLDEPLFDMPNVLQSESFSITADTYGGCQRSGGCASYRIEANGTYMYAILRREGNSERHEGKLSGSDRKELASLLQQTPLTTIHASTRSGVCPATADEHAYVYEIHTEDAVYRIDTCIHDTEGEALFKQLEEYFRSLR